MSTVTVEFFGVPRLRAGRSELSVEAATLGEALAAVERECIGLRGLRWPDGSLAPQYLASLNGRCFVRDLAHPLDAGEHVLLLSADVGG